MLTDMKVLPSPARALVTIRRLEKPGSAPGPNAERNIWRWTSLNSSETRVRVRDQSTMPTRSNEAASTGAARPKPVRQGIGRGIARCDRRSGAGKPRGEYDRSICDGRFIQPWRPVTRDRTRRLRHLFRRLTQSAGGQQPLRHTFDQMRSLRC